MWTRRPLLVTALAALSTACQDPPDEAAPVDAQPVDARPVDARLPDAAAPDGALPDGALPDGALPDGALPDGALPDGALPDAAPANACPAPAVARAREVARPLQAVPLESASRDPDGAIARWTWSVVARPDGSTAAPIEALVDPARPFAGGPPDDPSTPAAWFLPDAVGAYTLELRVADDEGLEAPSDACPHEAARMDLTAEAPTDVNIQLTWTAPDGGPGPDLDLHLRHPAGAAWGEAPYDCFAGNPRPDWGRPGDAADDAILGGHHSPTGPEVIALASPEETADGYRVGVSWPGAAEAVLRVYLGGALVDLVELPLGAEGGFRELGRVVWTPARRAFEPDQN